MRIILSTYRIIIICSCLPMKLWINSTKELDDTGYIVFEWLTYLPWNVCGIKRHTHAGKSQVCKAFPRNLYVVCHWFVFCCNKVSFFIFLRGLSSINFLFGSPYCRVKGFTYFRPRKTPPWYQIKTRMLLLIKHSATIRVGMSTGLPLLKRENTKLQICTERNITKWQIFNY